MPDVSTFNPQAVAEALLGLRSQDDVEAVARVAMRYATDPAFHERMRLQVLAIRQTRVEIAKRESSTFCELVLHNEKNGQVIRQASFHEQMHRMLRAYKRIIMWGSPNTGKCCVTGTLVLLSDGRQVPIESITGRVAVATFDPEAGEHRTLPAGPVFNNGVAPCVRVKTASGRDFTVTTNHRLRMAHGWMFAADLEPGDMLAAVRRVCVEPDGALSGDEAELLGYMLAEGGCTGHTPSWTNADTGLADRMSELCAARGWELKTRPNDPIQFYVSGNNGPHANSPARWCRDWDIACLAKHKRLPEGVWRAPDTSLARLIGAFWACDGHVSEARGLLEVTLASQGLIRDLWQACLRFGVVGRVSYAPKTLDGKRFPAWRLTIVTREAVARFAEAIPIPGPKGEALQRVITRPPVGIDRHDVIPAAWQWLHRNPPKRGRGFRLSSDSYRRPRGGNARVSVRAYVDEHPDANVERLLHLDLHWDKVVSVEDAGRLQTWGLPVHDKSHCFLSDGLIHHNSLQLAVGWPLWLLGRNPELHIAIVQATDERAKKTASALASYIAIPTTPGYAELHEVFPGLVQGSGIWNKSALTVRRRSNARDPSVAAYSTGSTSILGARIDVLILDDVLTFENTRTPEQRQKILEWIKSTLVGRVDPENGIILFMGNAWHPEDAMHVLAREGEATLLEDDDLQTDEEFEQSQKALASVRDLGGPGEGGWVSARFPLRDEYGRTTWTEVWPQSAIDRRARELGDAEASRQLDCTPTSDATSRFKHDWFSRCMAKGLYGSRDGKPVLARFVRPMVDVGGQLIPDGRAIYLGIDIGLEDDGDLSAIAVLAVDYVGNIEIMGVRSGHWKIDDFVALIFRLYGELKPRAIFVESNGAQRILARIVRGDLAGLGLVVPKGIRAAIRNFETGILKHHPKWGIEGIGIELAARRWKIPCGPAGELHPEIEAWIQDCMHYSPNPKIHTGDRLMAVYIAWDGFRRRLTRNPPDPSKKVSQGIIQSTLDGSTSLVFRPTLPRRPQARELVPVPIVASPLSVEERMRAAQERDVFDDLHGMLDDFR